MTSAKAEVRAKSGMKSGGYALRRRRNMKGGIFPKKRERNPTKREVVQRSFAKRESRSEGVKRRERCSEVGNDGKRQGMISKGVSEGINREERGCIGNG